MVLFYENTSIFKFNWEQVCKAFWCKYPNPYSAHVLTEDVISRKIDSEGKLVTKRLLSKTNKTPKWAEKLGLVQSKFCFIFEESIVDPINKLLITYTKNLGMKHICVIDEKVIYKIDTDNKTIIKRLARFESKMYGISKPIQAFAFERFKHNVSKALKGFQVVCEAMYSPLPAINKNLDARTISQLHPILKEKLLEKTRNLNL